MKRVPFRDRSPIHKAIWKTFFAFGKASADVTKAAIVHGVIDLGPEARRRARNLDTSDPTLYG